MVLSVAITGLAVLTGLTRIEDPLADFAHPWADSTRNGNALATAFVKTHFAFVGWGNAFNVLAEVRSREPVRIVRNAGRISLLLVSTLFLLTNVAYVAAIPKEEIKQSGQLVGALFFRKVFGEHWAAKILPLMVAVTTTIGLIRVGREGLRITVETLRETEITRSNTAGQTNTPDSNVYSASAAIEISDVSFRYPDSGSNVLSSRYAFGTSSCFC